MATLGSQQFDNRTLDGEFQSESNREKDSLLTHLSSNTNNGKELNEFNNIKNNDCLQMIELNDINGNKMDKLKSASIDSNDSLLAHDEENIDSQFNDCQSPIKITTTMKNGNNNDNDNNIDDNNSSRTGIDTKKESFFAWFYFSINCGSLMSYTLIAYLCQNVSFGIGFVAITLFFSLGMFIFIGFSKHFYVTPPKGSVVAMFFKIIWYGIKNKQSRPSVMTHVNSNILVDNNNDESNIIDDTSSINGTHWLDVGKISCDGPFDDYEVESSKSVLSICVFMGYFVVYWFVFFQLSTLFVAQGCQMVCNYIAVYLLVYDADSFI